MLLTDPIEFHLPTVSSTNDYARELLSAHNYVFVTASYQTAGRGRSGRTWEGDAHANAYCSFGLRHTNERTIEDLSAFMARGSLAVMDVIQRVAPQLIVRLKYPNDVQVHTHDGWSKIAGVLVDHEFQGQICTTTIVGIGCNVEQMVFSDTITQPCTSLRLLGVQASVETVLTGLRDSFSRWKQTSSQETRAAWIGALGLTRQRIRIVDVEGVWVFLRILADGRLVLQHEVSQNERTISDGDTLRYQD